MTNYKELSALISEKKAEICRKLVGLSLPSDAEEIQQLCVDSIGVLTRKDSKYMQQLSLLEQDLLTPVLKVMDTMYASDIELSQKVRLSLNRPYKPVRKRNGFESMCKEYAPALTGAAGGTILATICKPTSWGVILLGSVVSAIVGKVLYGLYVDKNSNVIAEVGDSDFNFPEYQLTNEDVENIVSSLVSIGNNVDTVLLTYRRHLQILQDEHKKKEQYYDLDKKYIGVLESFQELLGNLSDMEQTPTVKDSVRKITQVLLKQGFNPIDYNGDNQDFFNVKEDEIENIEQFSPAIVKITDNCKTLVLKGNVVLPKHK